MFKQLSKCLTAECCLNVSRRFRLLGLLMSAYSDGLKLLARRELSVADLRTRLLDREHSPNETEEAIAKLLETGALDDRRVARAYARTASKIKGRGRVRVTRELQAMGIPRDVIAAASGLPNLQATLDLLRVEHLIRTHAASDRLEVEAYHDRIREVTSASLTAPDALARHRALAGAWEADGRADPAVLAEHYVAVG